MLTFALLAVVVSGGEYKADCLKWWSKTVRLVKHLGLHRDPGGEGEEDEEKRRAFWLVYALDRHLALSHNRSLDILDAECLVYTPVPEHAQSQAMPLPRPYGPPDTITGTSFFEYFLPLMAILGDIIELRLRRHHPRLSPATPTPTQTEPIKASLAKCTLSLSTSTSTSTPHANLVTAYATYILKVLQVLLHGEWDPPTMLESSTDWITSPSFDFPECAASSIAAAHAIADILTLDPELAFTPYMLGIYLFHGSFVLLLFAERMPQLGLNCEVEMACEVIIRAHESAIVTLSTDFQVPLPFSLPYLLFLDMNLMEGVLADCRVENIP